MKTVNMQALPERAAWLYITEGDGVGRDFRLGPQTTIGRDNSCDVILPNDSQVSSEHARIRMEGQEFVLYDLASLNGTYVNDHKLQRHFLQDDDRILIGSTKLVFKVTPKPGR